MSSAPQRVAILGATGHVGKCLTSVLLESNRHEVTAVVRNRGSFDAFVAAEPRGATCAVRSFEEFVAGEYDAVVNCVGVGTPAGVTSAGATIFELTERFDALVLGYLAQHPETRCIAFSSGAAYCGDFDEPASADTPAVVRINGIMPTDYYGVAKLAAETKHRAAADFAIVDLRLFGLFSRYAHLDASFFMSDVYRAIAQCTTLEVGPDDIVRDYVAPRDLAALVVAVMDAAPRNDVFDLYSAAPVAKMDVLAAFSARYGLEYHVLGSTSAPSATGLKPNYYSTNRRAASLGYQPSLTSLQTLSEEIDVLLELRKGGRQ